MATNSQPGLLRLPLEIRLQIYEHLLLIPSQPLPASTSLVSHPDYHEYVKQPTNVPSSSPATSTYTIQLRNISHLSMPTISRRSIYKIRADRFRARCIDSSYTCINSGSSNRQIHASILGVSRQIHAEATPVLYGNYTFDFDTNVEVCIPFLSDLTPLARASIRAVSIVKRALPYDKDFDRCEWSSMCLYLSTSLPGLTKLLLGVVAGLPKMGWGSVKMFEPDEFRTIARNNEEMCWVNDLAGLKGLKGVHVRACVEHCPDPMSAMMAFFVAFSASVETGFKEYLSARLVPVAKTA